LLTTDLVREVENEERRFPLPSHVPGLDSSMRKMSICAPDGTIELTETYGCGQ